MACGPQQQWCGQTEEPSTLAETNVRYWHFSDIPPALTNVHYRGKSGHDANGPSCRLMTQSGHRPMRCHGSAKSDPLFVFSPEDASLRQR